MFESNCQYQITDEMLLFAGGYQSIELTAKHSDLCLQVCSVIQNLKFFWSGTHSLHKKTHTHSLSLFKPAVFCITVECQEA